MTQQPPLSPRPLQIVRPWEPENKGIYRLIKAARQMGRNSSLVRAPQAWTGGNSVPSDVGQLGGAAGGGGLSIVGVDNTIVRMDGTTAIQDSAVTIADTTGAMLTPSSYVTGTVASPTAGVDNFVAINQAAGFPNVTVGRGAAYGVFSDTYVRWTDAGGSGQLDPAAFTGARTWTLPDATGTVLLSSTAYTAMPAFANASRIHGSGSGGTSSIELVAERFLSIDANGVGLADMSTTSLLLGSGSASAAAAEIGLANTLEIVGTTLGVAADRIGPTQIDESGDYTWVGTHSFTGGTITVPTAAAGDNDTSAASTAFVTGLEVLTAASIKITAPSVVNLLLPQNTSRFRSSGTGTITIPTISFSNGYFEIQDVTVGAGTAEVYVPIDLLFQYQQHGRRITIADLKLTIAKSTSTAGSTKIDAVAIARLVGTDNATTQTFTDVVSDTTDRLTGAASATPTTWTTGFADTQLTVDAGLWLHLTITHSAAATTNWRVYAGCNHSQVTYTTAN